MMRKILLTILFGIGIIFCLYKIIHEYRLNKEKTEGVKFSYKMKYYSLWAIIYSYLIYIQYYE